MECVEFTLFTDIKMCCTISYKTNNTIKQAVDANCKDNTLTNSSLLSVSCFMNRKLVIKSTLLLAL